MGAVRQFEKEKLVIPVLIARETDPAQVKKDLEAEFGGVDYESRQIPFTFTDFYNQEMGQDIRRIFLAFRSLIDPSRLASIKLLTNELEKNSHRQETGRSISTRGFSACPALFSLPRKTRPTGFPLQGEFTVK